MKKREKFASRLGFILVSAGCAIGLGNVWRFPYITGTYGGAAFVLMYLVFLVIFGLPIVVVELSVGRASRKSAAQSFDVLEPAGSKWHLHKYACMAGNYLLMMFYTTIAGWMVQYFVKMMTGSLEGLDAQGVGAAFGEMTSNAGGMALYMVITVVLCFAVCGAGLQNGVEKITKAMMVCLLVLMVILAVHSCTLPDGVEGVRFYLSPDFGKLSGEKFFEAMYAAMGQSFFTLSIGIGSIAIFGSYIGKERSLTGEAICITALDTFVAILSGLIIFPACASFGVQPDAGPSLIFVTLPNVFNAMPFGRLWGSLFFLFMIFAAFSTVIAVFENIVSFATDLLGCSRQRASWANMVLLILLSLPCVLGFTAWSRFSIPHIGGIMDLEDFIVSDNLLPIGSMVYLLFCTCKYGWGWKNFTDEADAGSGMKFPQWTRLYMTWLLPLLVLFIFVRGYIARFFA